MSSFITPGSLSAAPWAEAPYEIKSPDKKITVRFVIAPEGAAAYSVFFREKMILASSRLGIVREDDDFSTALTIASASGVASVTDSYVLGYGKRKKCHYQANERVFHMLSAADAAMDIIFRVSNDGVGFRYFFPDKSNDIKKIKAEVTSFHFLPGAKAWLHHSPNSKDGWCQTQPSYEENYRMGMDVGTEASFHAGWVMPGLFAYEECWLTVSETGLDRNYCGSRLSRHSPDGEYSINFPQATEGYPGGSVAPESALPWSSPWRIIGVGDSLSAIAESTLGTDLAGPAAYDASAYARPGRASWSWIIEKDDSITDATQQRYIDFAAAMQWEYCLIDAGWDVTIGYDKIRELAAYARDKKVGLFLWYNSAGAWNTTPQTPKNRMLTAESRTQEFQILEEMGIKGIKVDFFGGDGQSMIAYYQDILTDAHRRGLMVNFHGSTFPRGWQRTYPNLVNMEAVKGFEYITFDQGNADAAPSHCCVLPFTRNLYDTMDFTPMNFSVIPGIKRRTTVGFELATSVLFIAGIQHFAETPGGMDAVPGEVRKFLRDLPASWDEMKFIDGYPGKLVILARRAGKKWYVAAGNGENIEKSMSIRLPFAKAIRSGRLIGDGEKHGSFDMKTIHLAPKMDLEIKLKPYGGFVLVLPGGQDNSTIID
jgi:alpha-glucosidase